MTFSFVCEKCGKTITCNSDPSKWKQKICMDCRRAMEKPVKPEQRYTPPKGFDLVTYVAEMIVVYKTIKDMLAEEKIEVPEANIAQWTTSIMIQKDKA